MAFSEMELMNRLRGVIDRLGWYATEPCSQCEALIRYSVLDTSTVKDEGVSCPNGHKVHGDLRVLESGYRGLFQDAIELAAMVITFRTHFGPELSIVMAHTSLEVFFRTVVEAHLRQQKLNDATIAITLDTLKPTVGGYIEFFKSAGVISEKDTEFWNSLRRVSKWRDHFVHGGKGPSVEEAVEACEKIAEVFLRLSQSVSSPVA